ncbi:hypothetical protein NPIL_262461 [Nephila pilipes]|uniref:Uncharacterized protein n=1 Tax=Nephila pilipes TaxID=299642 RepID=A0A8X6Q2U8_NEPPI|nr:hypothetical protein NPIL_262461 [Nephila pilipes]
MFSCIISYGSKRRNARDLRTLQKSKLESLMSQIGHCHQLIKIELWTGYWSEEAGKKIVNSRDLSINSCLLFFFSYEIQILIVAAVRSLVGKDGRV